MNAGLRAQTPTAKLVVALAATSLIFTPAGRAEADLQKRPIDAAQIIKRTHEKFEKAQFRKPTNTEEGGLEFKLAPLIVQEVHRSWRPRGVGSQRTSRKHSVPFDTEAVFFHKDSVDITRVRYDQVTYLWWELRGFGCRTPPIHSTITTHGVRVVLNQEGTPILWEALTNDPALRVYYVAESLEVAARERFGEPLPGRNFSIERGIDDTPGVVVARILDDGPLPMGPYVYIDMNKRDITTILCRCMDSQFEEAVETVEYQLEPLESLDTNWFREIAKTDLDRLIDPGPLDELFRWPKNTP